MSVFQSSLFADNAPSAGRQFTTRLAWDRQRYLAELQYCFNRRNALASMLDRLAYVTLRTPP